MHTMKQSKGYTIFKYILYLLLILFVVFPLYWILTTSFREEAEIMNTSLALIPKTFTTEHYREALVEINLLQCLRNSLIITIGTVIISVSLGLLMAYAFARRNFKGKKTTLGTVMFTQFIPIVAYIIPLYLLMSKLGLLNTYSSLWITYMGIALPVAVVLLINYIKDVPVELEEAAYIDGCSPFGALVRIVLPLSMPGIISTAIFVFITIWQEYLVAVSFITKESAFTVSIALTKFQGAHGINWGGIMAGAVTISIPAIILFLSCRKLFTNNIAGGVKE